MNISSSPAKPTKTVQRRVLAVSVVLAAVLIVFLIATFDSGDRSLFEGRRVSVVVEEILRRYPYAKNASDLETLTRLGPERAVPELSRHLLNARFTESRFYASNWNRMPKSIQTRLPRPEMHRQISTLRLMFDELHAAPSNSVPALIRIAEHPEDDSTGVFALRYLSEAGPFARPSFPVLTNLLASATLQKRRMIYSVMAALDDEATEVIPYARAGLGDSDEWVRASSAEMMLETAKDTNSVYAASRKQSLIEGKSPARTAAIRRLGSLGPVATPALIELLAGIKSEPPATQRIILAALCTIPDESAETTRLLAGLVSAKTATAAEISLQGEAVRALMLKRQNPESAIPALLEAIRNNQARTSPEVFHALGRLRGTALYLLTDLVNVWAEQTRTDAGRAAALAIWNLDAGATIPATSLAEGWKSLLESHIQSSVPHQPIPLTLRDSPGLSGLLKQGAPELHQELMKIPSGNPLAR